MFFYNFSKKTISVCVVLCVLSTVIVLVTKYRNQNNSTGICIGIITPMDHTAIHQIISGFKEQFTSLYKKPVIFNVQCAQGDATLMRAIIQSFISQNVSIIAPIGKKATQMSMSMVTDQPIIGLAVELSEQERVSQQSCNVTGVCDEISRRLQIDMIKNIIPNIKKFTIVCSSTSEKDFPAIEEIINEAEKQNISVQKCMVQAMNEIYTISKIIDQDSQAIFVLKDHLIVSSINTLVQEAQKRDIPVITSDNGSVENGATMALGIEEKEIGRHGARLTVKVVKKAIQVKTHPVEVIDKLTVFVNKFVKTTQPTLFTSIENYAISHGYQLIEC